MSVRLKTNSHFRVLGMTYSAITATSIIQKAKLKRANANELFLEVHSARVCVCVIVRGTTHRQNESMQPVTITVNVPKRA